MNTFIKLTLTLKGLSYVKKPVVHSAVLSGNNPLSIHPSLTVGSWGWFISEADGIVSRGGNCELLKC
jgi:hypothetical protein